MEAFKAKKLPLSNDDIDRLFFLDALVSANAKLEVYKSKLDDSKLNRNWFLPTLQQKEALNSSLIEGTQATLDGVLVDQVNPNEKDKDLLEVRKYMIATQHGYDVLKSNDFSIAFIKELHSLLMGGKVRKNKSTIPGEFRDKQNYLGKGTTISYIPPVAEEVPDLMANFVEYLNETDSDLHPLVRAAILHAQFETIHPFMDGNGRVGRMLIPMYLFKQKQISLPCFFLSEALERDRFKYYALLNGIREKNDWSSWIQFFLKNVEQQCVKYIDIVDRINVLYETDLKCAQGVIKNSKVIDLFNLLYKYPVITTNVVVDKTGIPAATATRYLNALVEKGIIYTDGRHRNRVFYYYQLLDLLR